MSELCAICGEEARHRHHLTGRDGRRRYLDPELIAPLCQADHSLVHADWAGAGVKLSRGRTHLERAALGLRRVALYLARASEARASGSLVPGLAGWAARSADRLDRSAAALDRHVPRWREAPEV